MWLFFLAIAILIIYRYRSVIKSAANNLTIRGVEVPLLDKFSKQYPTYFKNVEERIRAFNEAKTRALGRLTFLMVQLDIRTQRR